MSNYVRVFAPNGEMFEVLPLNAHDLCAHCGWHEAPPSEEVKKAFADSGATFEAPGKKVEPVAAPVVEVAPVVENLDPAPEPLALADGEALVDPTAPLAKEGTPIGEPLAEDAPVLEIAEPVAAPVEEIAEAVAEIEPVVEAPVVEAKADEEVDLDALDKAGLLALADEKGFDLDGRKSEANLRADLATALEAE